MMWKREMDCLLSVCDYIVEFVPEDGNDLEASKSFQLFKELEFFGFELY